MSSGRLELQSALRSGDPLADAAVAALRKQGSTRPGASAWQRVCALAERDADCARLVDQVAGRPAWLDLAKLRGGGTLFSRHALEVTSTFTLGSLVETYLVPGIADLLASTGLLMHQVQARLAGTGKFVLDLVAPNAFEKLCAPSKLGGPDLHGRGVSAAMRVRLLHARVRAGAQRGRGPSAPVPINVAETLFTLCVHSVSVIRGLRRLGVHVDAAEAEAYQHLWRYAGYLMGVPEDLLAESIEAETRLHAHLSHALVAPNASSRALTQALVRAARFEPPLFLPQSTLEQLTRFLLGDATADALDLPAHARTQASLQAMARARQGLTRMTLPRPERLHAAGRPKRSSLAPALGYRYYSWIVHRSARVSGRELKG